MVASANGPAADARPPDVVHVKVCVLDIGNRDELTVSVRRGRNRRRRVGVSPPRRQRGAAHPRRSTMSPSNTLRRRSRSHTSSRDVRQPDGGHRAGRLPVAHSSLEVTPATAFARRRVRRSSRPQYTKRPSAPPSTTSIRSAGRASATPWPQLSHRHGRSPRVERRPSTPK